MDRNRIVIKGEAAAIRFGYQLAATLGAWHLEGDSFNAQVLSVDGFRITQAPLTLEVHWKDGAPTRRPIADVSLAHGQLSARLLPR